MGSTAATALTAKRASLSAPWASTSATARSSNASSARFASTPATTSWPRSGRPQGLIAYETFRNVDSALEAEQRVRYGSCGLRTGALFCADRAGARHHAGWAWVARSPVEISVIEDRNPLFVKLSDGGVRNGYTLKILNKTPEAQAFQLSVEGLPVAEFAILGQETSEASMIVEPSAVRAFKVYVAVPARAKASLTASSMPLANRRDGPANG